MYVTQNLFSLKKENEERVWIGDVYYYKINEPRQAKMCLQKFATG